MKKRILILCCLASVTFFQNACYTQNKSGRKQKIQRKDYRRPHKKSFKLKNKDHSRNLSLKLGFESTLLIHFLNEKSIKKFGNYRVKGRRKKRENKNTEEIVAKFVNKYLKCGKLLCEAKNLSLLAQKIFVGSIFNSNELSDFIFRKFKRKKCARSQKGRLGYAWWQATVFAAAAGNVDQVKFLVSKFDEHIVRDLEEQEDGTCARCLIVELYENHLESFDETAIGAIVEFLDEKILEMRGESRT